MKEKKWLFGDIFLLDQLYSELLYLYDFQVLQHPSEFCTKV